MISILTIEDSINELLARSVQINPFTKEFGPNKKLYNELVTLYTEMFMAKKDEVSMAYIKTSYELVYGHYESRANAG